MLLSIPHHERERRKDGREGGGRQSIRRETIDGRTGDGQVCEGLRLHFNTKRPEHGINGMARGGGGIRAVSNHSIKDPSIVRSLLR